MCKKSLPDGQMPNVSAVDQAARWSRELVQMRSRGPGDLQNAMRAIEREYGVDYWTQWALRYRAGRFKDIGTTVFQRLRAAYEAECARQRRRFDHEISIARRVAGPAHDAVRQAEALLEDSRTTRGVQKTFSQE